MYIFKLLTLFSIILAVSGCASKNLIQRAEKFEIDVKLAELKSEVSDKTQLEKQLKSLVAEAKLKGQMSLQFLSGDFFFKASDASVYGHNELAALLYKMILEMYPKDTFIEKRYVVELVRVNELSEAKERLEKVVANEKFSDESMALLLGGLQAALDEGEKAKKTYQSILKKHPKSEEGCIFLAKSYSLESKFKRAKTILRKCEKKIKGRGIFSYYLGKIEVNQGRLKQAKKAFKKSLKIDPVYVQSIIALGGILEREEKRKGAIKLYREFLKRGPENYQVLSRIVQLLFSAERYKEVLPYAKTLSLIDPNDLNLKVRLGILYTDIQDFEKAKIVFENVLKEVPSSDKVIYYLASLYQQTGEMLKAVETFSKLDENGALFHDGYIQIGKILEGLAQIEYEEKRKSFGENYESFRSFVVKSSKKHDSLILDLNMMMASFYESNRLYDNAILILEEVGDHENFSNDHKFYLASLHEKHDDFSKAEKIVESILKRDPDNANALNFLGYSYVDRGINLEKAFIYIQKAVRLKPKDGYIRDSLGWYYYKVGKYDDALREITLAWDLTKNDPVILRHLAMVYQKKKHYTKAHDTYMEALKHCVLESEKIVVQEAIQKLNHLRMPASK